MADTLTHRSKSVGHDTSSATLVRSLRAQHRSTHIHLSILWSHPGGEDNTHKSTSRCCHLAMRHLPPFEGTVALLPPTPSDLKLHLLSSHCGQAGAKWEIKDAASLQLRTHQSEGKTARWQPRLRSIAKSPWGTLETMRPVRRPLGRHQGSTSGWSYAAFHLNIALEIESHWSWLSQLWVWAAGRRRCGSLQAESMYRHVARRSYTVTRNF